MDDVKGVVIYAGGAVGVKIKNCIHNFLFNLGFYIQDRDEMFLFDCFSIPKERN